MNTDAKFIPFTTMDTVGAPYEGSTIVGWARTNTSESGQRHIGFGFYNTDVVVKLADGRRVFATACSIKPF